MLTCGPSSPSSRMPSAAGSVFAGAVAERRPDSGEPFAARRQPVRLPAGCGRAAIDAARAGQHRPGRWPLVRPDVEAEADPLLQRDLQAERGEGLLVRFGHEVEAIMAMLRVIVPAGELDDAAPAIPPA